MISSESTQSEFARDLWRGLSNASRAMFFWPEPGAPRTDLDDAFSAQVEKETPIPDTFAVLGLVPTEVEHLDLKPHPHERRVWTVNNEWNVERVNP